MTLNSFETNVDADATVADPGTFQTTFKWIQITEITIGERDRKLDESHVQTLIESFARLGGRMLLQPILVTHDMELVAGYHRLTAAERSGWDLIPAMVAAPGLSREALRFLEFEENRARSTPSPLELLEGWETIAEPLIRAEAAQSRKRHLRQGTESPVARNSCHGAADSASPFTFDAAASTSSNRSDEEAPGRPAEVSTREAVKEYTGYSAETLSKIREVRDVAADEAAPEPVRKAALRSVQELSEPGAKIEPAHRRVVQAQAHVRLDQIDPKTLEAERLRDVLDRVLKDTSLLAERLEDDLGSDLRRAVLGGDEVARQDLAAVRTSLKIAFAQIAAISFEAEHEAPVSKEEATDEFFELSVRFQERALDAIDSFGGTR